MFQLFSEPRDTFFRSNGLREFVPLCGSSYCETGQPSLFFGLDEEINRHHVRSPGLMREERYGGGVI